jgi:hypothetical protein
VAAIAHNAKLNDLVIDLGRSLLQYAAEGSAWSTDAASHRRLADWSAAQQRDVGRMVELLVVRGWPVDFGTYPTDFTDLQFLSLRYFLPKLLTSQQQLVAELDESVHTCVDDAEAVALLREICEEERRIATEMQAAALAAAPVAKLVP